MTTAQALPLWFDVMTMTLNAAFGAAVARSRSFPVYGTLIGGVLVGLGGGIVRDVLLGHEPAAVANPVYIPFVLGGSLVGALAYRAFTSRNVAVQIGHAATLGFLVTIGAQVALHTDAPFVSAVLLGVVTASAGGMIVDAMSVRRTAIADPAAHWYASALTFGSIAFVLVSTNVSFGLAVAAGVAVTTTLDVTSTRLGWLSPLWPGEHLPAGESRPTRSPPAPPPEDPS